MIKINGETWKLFLVSPNHPMLKTPIGTFTLGACDNISHSIFINQNLNSRKMKKVLCHEITHAAMFSYNVELTLEQEELLADLLATYGSEIIEVTNKIFTKLKRSI